MGKQLEPEWRTSSYTGTNGNCVEVGNVGRVLVRDTKDRDGGTLTFGPDTWRQFAARIKGEDRA